jgi:hypothetical protein
MSGGMEKVIRHLDVNPVGRDGVGPRPAFLDDLDEFLGDVHAPTVGPAVFEPAGKLLRCVVVEHVHVEFALMRQAGEREVAGAEEPDDGVDGVRAEAEVELGVERVPKEQLHDHLAGLELRGETAQTGFILIRGRAEGELGAELLRQLALQPDDGLLADLLLMRQQAVGLPEFLLRHTLHPDKQSALAALAARPLVNQRINRLPAAQIEIANAEVRAVGEFKGLPQGGQQLLRDVIEDARHGCSLARESALSGMACPPWDYRCLEKKRGMSTHAPSQAPLRAHRGALSTRPQRGVHQAMSSVSKLAVS